MTRRPPPPAAPGRPGDLAGLLAAGAGSRWKAAVRALAGGQLPSSRTEQAIFRIAASLAAGVPVRLGDTVTGLDHANLDAVTTAIWHAGGHRRR